MWRVQAVMGRIGGRQIEVTECMRLVGHSGRTGDESSKRRELSDLS